VSVRHVVYVAGPFRGPDAWTVAQNVRRAEETALEVWRLGAACICPHANAAHFQGTLPDHVWLDGDLEMLRRCDAVLMVDGWGQSVGAKAEREEALRCGIPVLYSLGDLKDWLQREDEAA
jgi:hypothetical protein